MSNKIASNIHTNEIHYVVTELHISIQQLVQETLFVSKKYLGTQMFSDHHRTDAFLHRQIFRSIELDDAAVSTHSVSSNCHEIF